MPERPGVQIIAIGEAVPRIHDTAWVAPGVTLIGDVEIGADSSVFYGSVLRADQERIVIGRGTNVQDNTVIHSDPGRPAVLGDRVSVGHRALIHGCQVADDVLVGMSATVLNDATVGSWSLIAAGAVVLEGTTIPENSLVAGVPGKIRRELGPEDRERVERNAAHYLTIAETHRERSRIVSLG